MAKFDSISSLGPGDKFIYQDTSYIIIDLKLSESFLCERFPDIIFALNLDNYKIECFNPKEQVEIVYYYGGI